MEGREERRKGWWENELLARLLEGPRGVIAGSVDSVASSPPKGMYVPPRNKVPQRQRMQFHGTARLGTLARGGCRDSAGKIVLILTAFFVLRFPCVLFQEPTI